MSKRDWEEISTWEQAAELNRQQNKFVEAYILEHFGPAPDDEEFAMSEALTAYRKLQGFNLGPDEDSFILPEIEEGKSTLEQALELRLIGSSDENLFSEIDKEMREWMNSLERVLELNIPLEIDDETRERMNSWEQACELNRQQSRFLEEYILEHFGPAPDDEEFAMSEALNAYFKLQGFEPGPDEDSFILPEIDEEKK
ncbi:hypothetical protein J2T17_004343 [Paenibacillus mucilaginosus]|uniref:hypothetical protein n=1 Tax=Paenibacillus mucilaginosus TaxID=61624 RepID=UPI003D21A93E